MTDWLMKNFPKSVVFFYPETLSAELLIVALEKILFSFPIFSGRLRIANGSLLIDCNNEGVRFSLCDESSSLAQTIENLSAANSHRLVDRIDPKRAIAQQYPVLTIRLTQFSNGGTALGICWHHAIGDMSTFMTFLKAWSAAVNGVPYISPSIVEDRSAYLLQRIPENKNLPSNVRYLQTKDLLKLAIYLQTTARRRTSVKILFSDSELKKMKQVFSEKAGQTLSRNDVLCAHLSSLIANLDDYDRDRYLAIAVNYRNKLGLPQKLLGNLLDAINIPLPQNTSPSEIALKIRTGVDYFATRHLSVTSTHKYIENNGGAEKINRFLSKSLDPIKRSIAISSWANFGVYDITFLDASPLYVTSVGDSPIPWICSIVEGFENKGLIYTATLPKQLVRKLTQPDSLQRLHKYRSPSETRSSQTESLSWLL